MAEGWNVKKKRKSLYRKLLAVSNEVFAIACKSLQELETFQALEAAVLYDKLERHVELAAVAPDQCERRILKDEKVSADDKIVSIFEDHTDIVKRGKSQCPTEFGHKISTVTCKSGIKTQYEIFKGNPGDDSTLEDILDCHIRQHEKPLWHFSADRRLFSAKNEELLQNKGVKRVSIKKAGLQVRDPQGL
jgi:IS5 family transposase